MSIIKSETLYNHIVESRYNHTKENTRNFVEYVQSLEGNFTFTNGEQVELNPGTATIFKHDEDRTILEGLRNFETLDITNYASNEYKYTCLFANDDDYFYSKGGIISSFDGNIKLKQPVKKSDLNIFKSITKLDEVKEDDLLIVYNNKYDKAVTIGRVCDFNEKYNCIITTNKQPNIDKFRTLINLDDPDISIYLLHNTGGRYGINSQEFNDNTTKFYKITASNDAEYSECLDTVEYGVTTDIDKAMYFAKELAVYCFEVNNDFETVYIQQELNLDNFESILKEDCEELIDTIEITVPRTTEELLKLKASMGKHALAKSKLKQDSKTTNKLNF